MSSLSLMHKPLALTALAILALGGSSTVASAQDAFYTTGTYTIDATHSVAGSAIVGQDSSFSRTDSTGNP